MSEVPGVEPADEDELATRAQLQRRLLENVQLIVDDHPRSKQKRIGPSGVGTPCVRSLGYRILDHPRVNLAAERGYHGFLPFIGTSVHARLEFGFDDITKGRLDPAQAGQWLTERRVRVAEGLEGTADLYDLIYETVVDWKIVGNNTMTKVRRQGPGDKYRIQAHLYGKGYADEGAPVQRICIAFLPRNGELSGAFLYFENYRPDVAAWGIERLERVEKTMSALGAGGLHLLPVAEDYCESCPWFRPMAARDLDPAIGCPGAVKILRPAPAGSERAPALAEFLQT